MNQGQQTRGKAISRLKREVFWHRSVFLILLLAFLAILGWATQVGGLGGFLLALAVIGGMLTGIKYNWALYRKRQREVENLSAFEPLIEAYRNGRSFVEANPPRTDADRMAQRDKYHSFAELADTQIVFYKEEQRQLTRDGKTNTVSGVTALLLDIEDAKRQAEKELALLDRAYHSIQQPRVEMARPPIKTQKETEETGLERY